MKNFTNDILVNIERIFLWFKLIIQKENIIRFKNRVIDVKKRC